MIAIEEKLFKLITKKGFIEAFWTELRELRVLNPAVTQRQVYEMLDEKYEKTFGERKFSSFEAFRKERDKLIIT